MIKGYKAPYSRILNFNVFYRVTKVPLLSKGDSKDSEDIFKSMLHILLNL